MSEINDPVAERRADIARKAGMARRIGYSMWLVAVVLFFVALVGGFSSGAMAQAIVILIIAGSVLLLPAIIIGYGVNAATRDENREKAEAARASD